MKIKINSNMVSGVIFLIFSLVVWFLIPVHIVTDEETFANAQFIPRLLMIIIFLSSISLIAKEAYKKIKNIESDKLEIDLKKESRVLIMFGILIIYTLIMPVIGFIFSSIIVGCVSLVLMKVKNWKYYLTIIISVVIVYYVFQNLLHVQLP